MQAKTLIPALLALAMTSVSAFAQAQPSLIKKHNSWAAFTHNTAQGKVCYALAEPRTLEPTDRNHGKVYFFVSSRPSQNVTDEPSFIVGYPFRAESSVAIDVDGKKYVMFTNNDGAWMRNAALERELVGAMKAGREMVVSGVSARGTQTTYRFSLSGVTAAIRDAASACQ